MPAEDYRPPAADTVRSYAIRRINPFLGVLQIIDGRGGRALSANGVVWEIEIRAERQSSWGSLNRNSGEVAYYRYGLWSQEDGLVTRPLTPQLDNEFFAQQCSLLIDRIRGRLGQLRFRLTDTLELWLFDQDGLRPLALLASAIPGSSLPSPEPRYWSSGIGANGVPGQRRYPAASQLETMVRQRAGFNIASGLTGRTMAAASSRQTTAVCRRTHSRRSCSAKTGPRRNRQPWPGTLSGGQRRPC